MKRIFLLSIVAFTLSLAAKATITVVPTPSTGGTDIWYYVKCSARQANHPGYQWLCGATDGQNLSVDSVTVATADNFKWKVVPTGTGYALYNKAYGTYLNATSTLSTGGNPATYLSAATTSPAVALQFAKASFSLRPKSVFVCDNVMVVTDSLGNYSGTPQFVAYAAGSGYTYHLANLTSYKPMLVHSAFAFYTDTEFKAQALVDAIVTVTYSYNNCSAGPNPGQFNADDLSALGDAIAEAQAVLDEPSSTQAQYDAAAASMNTIYNNFLSTAITPEVSDIQDVWYCLQGTRPANTYVTAVGGGSGAQLKATAVTVADDQLWKIVANPNGGYALFNKANGEYLNSDTDQTPSQGGLSVYTKPEMPTKGLGIDISPEITNKTKRFYIENTNDNNCNFRLHAGTSQILNWTGGKTDNCSWLFFDYNAIQREYLKSALIPNLQSYITRLAVGTNPGQITQTVLDHLNSVLASVQVVANNTDATTDEVAGAVNSVQEAKNYAKTNANLPVISPDDPNTVWYTFTGQRPTSYTGFIYNNSSDSVKYEALKAVDSELWRLVPNGAGFALQNKATGKYINTDVKEDDDNISRLTTQAAMPATPLKFVVSDSLSNGAFRFKIVNSAATDVTQGWTDGLTFNMHAAGGDAPMNYLDPTDNSAWLIADAKQAIANALTNLLAQVQVVYTKSAKVEGDTYYQYSASSRATLNSAITQAASVNVNTATYQQIQDALTSLTNASTAFQNSRNTDLASVMSTAASPKWFSITNVGTATATTTAYAFGKRIGVNSSDNKAYGVAANNTDNLQLWRFEVSTTNDDGSVKTFKIINASDNSSELLMTNTNYILGALVSSGTGSDFGFKPHNDGYSLIIDFDGNQVHCDQSSNIVRWTDSDNPNNAWKIERVILNSVKNVTVNNLVIRNNAGVITVDGAKNFELYSIMGQRLDTRASHQKGIYVVKVGNQVQKYILK